MEHENAFDRIADRAEMLAVATISKDAALAAAVIEDELDRLTIDSIRYWSRCTPTDGERLIPERLLAGFIEAAGRRKKRRP